MTIRLACVSTAPNTNAILEQLIARGGDGIELAFHLGSRDAHYKASSLSKLSRRQGTKGHLMAGDRYARANLDLLARPDFQAQAAEFVDHLHRDSDMFKFNGHNIRAVQDYLDYYHIISDVLGAKLRDERVTHVLFFNVPHLTYDTVLYQMAKAMGLPVLIVTQSLFAGKFFSLTDVADFGRLRKIEPPAPPFPIEKGQELDLFYMKGVAQERGELGRISWSGVVQLFAYLLTRRPLDALNPVYLWKTVGRMRKVYGGLPAWRDPFAKFFHDNSLAYFEHILQFEETPVDLNRRYVYFAMQLQPEMTTSSLGGIYVDQALAIEHLSALLPEDVHLYVKDNPKQLASMRGPMFFHRLQRLENVTIVPSYTDTHALTDHSEFVATITGTVGWEAIRKGKRALVFGKAWYGDFPGVTRMRTDLTFDEIVNAPLEHEALEAAAGNLVAALHDGVVDRHYTEIVDGHDADGNAVRVADVLAGLLHGEKPVVFQRDG